MASTQDKRNAWIYSPHPRRLWMSRNQTRGFVHLLGVTQLQIANANLGKSQRLNSTLGHHFLLLKIYIHMHNMCEHKKWSNSLLCAPRRDATTDSTVFSTDLWPIVQMHFFSKLRHEDPSLQTQYWKRSLLFRAANISVILALGYSI